uniref:Zgc:112980 n=1 Tax=Mastacembelus armatus TaxID=205130 RepID=A0A7N9AYW7_9TELE
MCTTGDSGEIIILSDDDDDDDVECDEEDDEPSVLITPLDEDLVVTFSRRAEVLPHARYDCPIHPFLATDNETNAPVATNYLICEQCFCYICDKLASECAVWCHSGCHCNSHKRSDFWNNIRKNLLLGVLHTFNLTLSEIDTHLRQAGSYFEFTSLFIIIIIFYLLICSYRPVYEFVSSFLNKADQQDGRAAAVMKLGAAEDFCQHFQFSGYTHTHTHTHTRTHSHLLTHLCVRHWDDVLLTSVLKGQNVLGFRKDKGKKDVLLEQISVVLLRAELLQRQRRYTIVVYTVSHLYTTHAYLTLTTLAVQDLFVSQKGPACRLTPSLFLVYLRIFETATAPNVIVYYTAELCGSDVTWEPIKGQINICYNVIIFSSKTSKDFLKRSQTPTSL